MSVSKKVMAVNKSPSVSDEIDFKISKLKDSLLQQIDSLKKHEIMQHGFTPQIEEKFKYLCRACEIAEVVCYIQNTSITDQRKL